MNAVAVGVDGWRDGWVAIAVRTDRPGPSVAGGVCSPTFAGILERWPGAVVGVDMPIGLVAGGPRRCDTAAKAFVGTRRSSVFAMPAAEVMRAPTYADALAVSRAATGVGLSRQAWALRTKIDDVAAAISVASVTEPPAVYEVFPEAAFCAMAGTPLAHPKRTFAGMELRRALLARAGVSLDAATIADAALAPPDDVLDAAAAAWSAARIARGDAVCLPPDAAPGEPAIWY